MNNLFAASVPPPIFATQVVVHTFVYPIQHREDREFTENTEKGGVHRPSIYPVHHAACDPAYHVIPSIINNLLFGLVQTADYL